PETAASGDPGRTRADSRNGRTWARAARTAPSRAAVGARPPPPPECMHRRQTCALARVRPSRSLRWERHAAVDHPDDARDRGLAGPLGRGRAHRGPDPGRRLAPPPHRLVLSGRQGRRGATSAENSPAATSRTAARPRNSFVASFFPWTRATTEP